MSDDFSSIDSGGAGQGPSSRWNSFQSRLGEEHVREALRRELARQLPAEERVVLAGAESKRGFVQTFKAGSRTLIGEVDLASWDGGTQIHVAVPAEQKARDFKILVDWLTHVLR